MTPDDIWHHEHPLALDIAQRHASQTPFTSSDFRNMTDEEHAATLHHSAQLQRGAAEDAMLTIRGRLGGGFFPYVAEHVGDLYWRANSMGGGNEGYWNDVDNKVDKSLDTLLYRHGFENEMERNIKNNREFNNDPTINWRTAEILGRDYANEHAKLPIYTYPSSLMAQATHHLGNLRFGATVGALQQLQKHMPVGNEVIDKIQANAWKRMHSREATINFLESMGR